MPGKLESFSGSIAMNVRQMAPGIDVPNECITGEITILSLDICFSNRKPFPMPKLSLSLPVVLCLLSVSP